MTAVPTARGSSLSTGELAVRLNRPSEWIEQLMFESEEDGVVEQSAEGWRLTSSAERAYGRALRSLTMPRDAA